MAAKERPRNLLCWSDERTTLNMAEPSKAPDVSSPSGKQAKQHEPSSTIERKYEFFVTTGEPHQPEGVERGKIRRLVMRNFFDSKSTGSQTNISEHSSASTALAKKQLKSRFRLSNSNDDSKDIKGMRGNSKEEENKGKEKRPRASRKTSVTSQKSAPTTDTRGIRASLAKPKQGGNNMQDSDTEPADRRLILKVDLSPHRFDPFDVLPVPGTQQLDTLFKLCTSLKWHRYAVILRRGTLG
jgi:hypothetical protein